MSEREGRRLERSRCPGCGVEQPTDEEWATTREGDRDDLCWDPGDSNCDVFRTETFARMKALDPR